MLICIVNTGVILFIIRQIIRCFKCKTNCKFNSQGKKAKKNENNFENENNTNIENNES